MGEKFVVGAGLAGLTAAINLAKGGHDVVVVEREKHVGGLPEAHPSVDATPINPERLSAFVSVELKEPQVRKATKQVMYIYGKKYEVDVTDIPIYVVERGHRKTALDCYLYEQALECGVKFEFSKPITCSKDMAELPPNTIIASGLYHEVFELLNLPYETAYGFIAKGKTELDRYMAAWFGKYTEDYAYISCSNGIVFGLFFQRKPVSATQRELWFEKLESDEGVVFKDWIEHFGPVPTHRQSRPCLFAGNKILAGTISGSIDPFLLFGVHGALVSGKIAAIAVENKAEAYEIFRKFNRNFIRQLIMIKTLNMSPSFINKSVMGSQFYFQQKMPRMGEKIFRIMTAGVPGFGDLA